MIDLLTEDQHGRLERVCRDRMKELAQQVIPGTNFDPWPFPEYHKLSLVTDEVHQKLMAPATRYFSLDPDQERMVVNEATFPFLERHWGHRNVSIKMLMGEELVDGTCVFRFVRPASLDVSGVHAETNYNGYYITLWIPLAGFDEHYTLKLSPGSHAVDHPAEQIAPDRRFKARPYSDAYTSKFEFIRPNMRKGQAILFHPNLLHGGSHNLGDSTRVSVEVRLYENEGFD